MECVTSAFCPCNAPRLDDMSCGCLSTGPEPDIFTSGFVGCLDVLGQSNAVVWGSLILPQCHCSGFGRRECRSFSEDGTGGVSGFPWVLIDDMHSHSRHFLLCD